MVQAGKALLGAAGSGAEGLEVAVEVSEGEGTGSIAPAGIIEAGSRTMYPARSEEVIPTEMARLTRAIPDTFEAGPCFMLFPQNAAKALSNGRYQKQKKLRCPLK
jgi:hypothetical protein